ncbi:hypothetical protein [Flavobacterium sp.]|uniref:hypothetical protein n=1 Tax=Flavobacterium sp. TaxID=239 RepID=UPI003750BF35
MKIFKITFLAALVLLVFTGCDTNDDDFYNSEYITIPNLVQIQTQATYNVGDYLYVNASINRLQTEAGQTTQLDIRKTTNNAPSFSFSYMLEKKVNADWILVDANLSTIDLDNGQFESGSFYNATAVFDTQSDSYEFLNGVKLTTTGQYRLSFGYNSSSTNLVEMRSNSVNGAIFLNLLTTTNNLDADGFYNFTVN